MYELFVLIFKFQKGHFARWILLAQNQLRWGPQQNLLGPGGEVVEVNDPVPAEAQRNPDAVLVEHLPEQRLLPNGDNNIVPPIGDNNIVPPRNPFVDTDDSDGGKEEVETGRAFDDLARRKVKNLKLQLQLQF